MQKIFKAQKNVPNLYHELLIPIKMSIVYFFNGYNTAVIYS